MNFEFSEEQLMLRDQARGYLAQNCPPQTVRNVLDGPQEYDSDLWQGIVGMGWTATTIPEAYGGLGLGYYELAIIAEELGRAVAPVPFSSSVYLATEAILAFGDEAQKTHWLPKLAAGECIATFAHAEGPGRTQPNRLRTQVGEAHLTGMKAPIPDGLCADIAIVSARGDNDDSVRLCLVDLAAEGVEKSAVRTLDFSRGHATLTFDKAPTEPLGEGVHPRHAFERLYDRAAVLMAWEQLGLADMALEQACDYAKQRYAFGRAIGTFQAIKHKLAGMYVKNTLARSNGYHGAWALASDSETLPLAAATARVAAIQASLHATQENIQTHGGMGFTWEFDCQFYYRRAKLLSLALGSERHWQDRLVSALATGDDVAA